MDFSKKPSGYYSNERPDMLKYIPSEARKILEFGCGQGNFSKLLMDKPEVETWGIEINPDAARKAEENLTKVIFTDALDALPEIPDNYFDCVIFFDILEHLADPYTLLSQVKEKLTKNGLIVASVPNVRYYRTFVKYVFGGNWEYKSHGILDKTHLRFFTYKSICNMFKSIEFEIIKIVGIHPTSSKNFRLINTMLLNSFSDLRYKHYAVVARPRVCK